MAMILNTGHALAANVKMLIGVESTNAMVDLVTTGRTFTKHANAVYGSGTLGRHAGVRRSGYSGYGWTFGTSFAPANNTGTLILVHNAVRYSEYSANNLGAFISNNSGSSSQFVLPVIGASTNLGVAGVCYDGGGGVNKSAMTATSGYSASPMMMTLTRNGTGAYGLYINGNTTPEVSGTGLGVNGGGSYSYIGGIDGIMPMDFDLVWAVWFDAVLTPTQIADLYATLGASNAFGLVSEAGDVTAPTLTTPTGTQTGSTTATGTVSTNEANGTLYHLASINATETAATVKAASSQAVSATGTQTVSRTGLTASTAYYLHYVHRDAAGNDSTVATSAQFTTAVADVTAPILTLPTATQTGATTATGGVTTDEGNGTLYSLVSINATELAATVKASGITQAITTTGAKTVSFTGLTAVTSYYAHYVHRDAAGNDSARVSSAQFTTAAAPDVTLPTLTGSITASAITTTGFTISYPAGADNVGVAGYEYSLDAGASYTANGVALTKALSGLTPGTAYYVRVRDFDAAGNRSTPALAATITTLSATGTLTVTNKLKNNTATALSGEAGVSVAVLKASDFSWVLNATCTTDATGALSAIASTSIVPGTAYHVAIKTTLGGVGITAPVTAA